MRKNLLFLALLSTMSLLAQQKMNVEVSNPMEKARTDQPVIIPISQFGEITQALIHDGNGKEIPCQLDDLDQDGMNDELCFLVDLQPHEKATYTIKFSKNKKPLWYKPRVYAEMVMRNDKVKEKNKHNNYIESITARGDCANPYNLQHHHGVCFESELNGIRIYFDKRQTLDLYGKFHQRLELQETQFYTSKEQKEQEYGDDVLWVGNTFGLGAFRGWNGIEPTMIDPVVSRTQRIISYGPLRTIVEIEDKGWKADPNKAPVTMTLRYTQYAGHRDTDVDVFFNRNVSDYKFSTGIINVKGSEEFSDQEGLRACWGTDWPSTDTAKWNRETVGLAIYLQKKNIESEEYANNDNYAFVVKMPNNHMQYKICYTSANEGFGFRTARQWFDWLVEWK